MMPPRFLWLKQPRRGTSYIDVDEREDRGRMYGRMGGGRGVIQPVLRDFFFLEKTEDKLWQMISIEEECHRKEICSLKVKAIPAARIPE